MTGNIVRPIALCIVKDDTRILVNHGYDSHKKQEFYRLLGGGIEFGELGEKTLKREFQEELGVGLTNVKFLTVLENVFTLGENVGHEIVLLFEGELTDKSLYEKDRLRIVDKENDFAFWKDIDDFKNQNLILYPEGVLRFL